MTTAIQREPGPSAREAAASNTTNRPAAHPILIVAAKEWLDLRRDARWIWLTGLVAILMLTSLGLGLIQAQRLAKEHAAAESGDRRVWTSQGAKNPHSAAHFGQYAFKPVGPLAVADPGVDAYVGRAAHLEAHKQNEVQFRSARDGTSAGRMGQLTLAFVVQAILPLIAILLGFNAFSGEREQGTLPQLMSLGVRPRHVLLGKGLAALGVLIGLLVLAGTGLGIGLEILGPVEHDQPSLDPARLAGMFLGNAVYLSGFLALAMAVSARAKSSRSALVGLLGFWLLNCFLAPRLASDLVRSADPLPSAQAFRDGIAEAKKTLFGHDEGHPGFIAFKERILKEYKVRRVEDLPVSFRGLSLREDDEAGYRIFDAHYGRLHTQLERQDAIRAAAGFVFPMLAIQPFSMAMAGTDNAHHHRFVVAAEAHRRAIQTEASRDLIEHAGNNPSYVAPATLWERIPAFEYIPPSGIWAWQSQVRNLSALAAWCGGCCLLAWLAASRPRMN